MCVCVVGWSLSAGGLVTGRSSCRRRVSSPPPDNAPWQHHTTPQGRPRQPGRRRCDPGPALALLEAAQVGDVPNGDTLHAPLLIHILIVHLARRVHLHGRVSASLSRHGRKGLSRGSEGCAATAPQASCRAVGSLRLRRASTHNIHPQFFILSVIVDISCLVKHENAAGGVLQQARRGGDGHTRLQ